MKLTKLLWVGLVAVSLSGCGGGGGSEASGGPGAAGDTTPPAVASTSPASNATAVATNVAVLVTFGEALAASSAGVGNFSLNSVGGSVAGSVSVSGATLTLTPAGPLAHATTYTATVSGVADAAGNLMVGNQVWSFTTGLAPDTVRPTVVSTSPASSATGVASQAAISATFSEAMASASLSTTGLRLRRGSNDVPGAVTYSDNTATFTPSAPLTAATTYTATIAASVTDTAGNTLGADAAWTFTTAAASAASVLTDTGISASQCNGLGIVTLVACSSFDATRLNTQQDGMRGRDVSTPDPTDGKLGFRYSTVGAYPKTDCVRDDITGLVWEGKTASGPRAGSARFTHYDGSSPLQRWNGVAFVEPTQDEVDTTTNTTGYKSAVNSSGLCGFNDWRVPTADELHSLADYGVPDPGPQIDATWFPNVPPFPDQSLWWTSSPDVMRSGFAWYVYFGAGGVGIARRADPIHLRLVRSDR